MGGCRVSNKLIIEKIKLVFVEVVPHVLLYTCRIPEYCTFLKRTLRLTLIYLSIGMYTPRLAVWRLYRYQLGAIGVARKVLQHQTHTYLSKVPQLLAARTQQETRAEKTFSLPTVPRRFGRAEECKGALENEGPLGDLSSGEIPYVIPSRALNPKP